MIRHNEQSQETKNEIIEEMKKGIDQSLEQGLYCQYDYLDCFENSRCKNCNLSNYGRDCNNNKI